MTREMLETTEGRGDGKDCIAEKRRKRYGVRYGGATRGSSFLSCHHFNCFLAVVTMTGLQGD